MNNNFFLKGQFLTLLVLSIFTISCTDSDDQDSDGLNGQMRLELTDAPIDDTQIKSVFVTVADVKINGASWSGFKGRTTLDILAYQNGRTMVLGEGDLEAAANSEITLVLDNETDASGGVPGCYVLTSDNQKMDLSGDALTEIKVSSNKTTASGSDHNWVLDLDLRKALRYNSAGSGSSEYAFVTRGELQNCIRVVEKDSAATLRGTCTGNISSDEKLVVFAYKAGTFNASRETQGQGTSSIRFQNAVNSSIVGEDGKFQLSFMQAGDYELHFYAYSDNNQDGKMELSWTLLTEIVGALNSDLVKAEAGATLHLNVNILAKLPI